MTYTINNQIYKVIIERKKNRNSYIRIKEKDIIFVTTNYLASDRDIYQMLMRNEKAIQRMIQKKCQKNEKEEKFYYLGNVYDIIIVPTLDQFDIVGDKIYVKDEKMLNRWLESQMKTIFQDHYDFYYEKFQEEIPKYPLRIRTMKTRWGVCNRKSKTITLNSKLIEYPESCLDYVIVHELSHLVHFDHSKEFWETVGKYFPEYKKYRKMLKD